MLLYHYVCPSKYRMVVFSEAVDESIKCVFLEISTKYDIEFNEISMDKDQVFF